MSGAKALQWIVRHQRLKLLGLASYVVVGDAVGLEIGRVEGEQIPPPFGFHVGNDRPQPVERIQHLAAVLERKIYRSPLVPVLKAEQTGRDKQRQKYRDHDNQRTSEPPRRKAQSRNRHWPS